VSTKCVSVSSSCRVVGWAAAQDGVLLVLAAARCRRMLLALPAWRLPLQQQQQQQHVTVQSGQAVAALKSKCSRETQSLMAETLLLQCTMQAAVFYTNLAGCVMQPTLFTTAAVSCWVFVMAGISCCRHSRS
jgi:hypothetical protein